MRKAALTLAALLLLAGNVLADPYRVTYTYRGLNKRIAVQAESPAEARRTVQDLFPGAYVTNAHKVRR